MQSLKQHRQLFAGAIGIYLQQSLHAALGWRENCQKYANGAESGVHEQLRQHVDKLIRNLQNNIRTSCTLEVLCGHLAVLDRLEESVLSAMENLLSPLPSINMNQHSASFLEFAVFNEMQNDNPLAADWLLASQLCDIAASITWERHSDPASSLKALGNDRLGACSTVRILLRTFTELVIGEGLEIKAKYEFKEAVARNIQTRRASLKKALSLCALQMDTRLRCFLQQHCACLTNAIDQLNERYASSEVRHEESFRLLEQLISAQFSVWNFIEELQAASQHCSFVTAAGHDSHSILEYETFRNRQDALYDEIISASTCNEASQPPTLHFGCNVQRLKEQKTAIVRDLGSFVNHAAAQASYRGGKLGAYYRDKIREAAREREPGQDPQDAAVSWERAALAELTESEASTCVGQKFMHLAKGVVASTVTCHTQWERAVQRRDDKLADFWQRARERAWEVACKAFVDVSPYPNAVSRRHADQVIPAVKAALRAQALLLQTPSSPLMQAEGGLGLHVAMQILFRSDERLDYSYGESLPAVTDRVLRLVTVCNRLHDIAASNTRPAACGTENVVLWAAKILLELHELHRTHPLNKRNKAVSYILENTAKIARLVHDSEAVSEMCLNMLLIDMNVWTLQCRRSGDVIGIWVWETLIDAYCPTSNPADGDTQRSFRQHVAGELEVALREALLGSRPNLLQPMYDRWPPPRRRWLSSVDPGPSWSMHASKMVQTTVRALRMQLSHSPTETDAVAREMLSVMVLHVKDAVAQLELQFIDTLLGRVDTPKNHQVISATGYVVQCNELMLRAMELQNQAQLVRSTSASATCMEVLNWVQPVSNGGRAMFRKYAERPNTNDLECAKTGLNAMCRCGELGLCAAAAELAGRDEAAALWKAAFEGYQRSMFAGATLSPDQRLRSGWEEALQRAEALAEQARRAEVD
jgi:hypothetical protein